MDEALDTFHESAAATYGEYVEEENFGQYLRRHRENAGITLEEIGWATKIKSDYLLAMEQSDFSSLPGEIFAKGYIRAYAQYIGIDPEQAVTYYLGCQREDCVIPAESNLPERVTFLTRILDFFDRIKKLLTGREDFQVY